MFVCAYVSESWNKCVREIYYLCAMSGRGEDWCGLWVRNGGLWCVRV